MIAMPQRQRGVALLVALLVVALAVILVAALLDRGELALARTRNALRGEQAEAYAQGLEIYAAQILFMSQSESPGPDTNASPWALPLPPQPVPGGLIGATMRDMNGCFNLNNLSTANPENGKWQPIFASLLKNLGIDPNLAASVQSWLDRNSNGSDTNTYLALPVPYRPRRDVFAHVSELRLVNGVTGDVYAKLAPYVCALPPGTTINVNTASVPILESLGITEARALRVFQNGRARYADVVTGSFMTDSQLPTNAPVLPLLSTASTYFLARGDVVLDDVPFAFFSLIERHVGGPNGGIRVLERSRGSDDALTASAPVAAGSSNGTTLD